MNGYDFDKTIYDGNCFVDFYFYCLLRRPYIVLLLPYQLIVTFLYFLRVLDCRQYKQAFHRYLFFLHGKTKLINQFWQTHIRKIKPWYLQQKQEDDVIVSASPKFFLQRVCYLLSIKNLIATEMDMRTGQIKGENCVRENKVKMFQRRFGNNVRLVNFYSDSKKDIPMMRLAENAYFVCGHTLEKYHDSVN